MSYELADKLKEKTGLDFYNEDSYPLPHDILCHFEYLLDKIETLEKELKLIKGK